jgi:uncharacterized Tic20 family protein
VTVEKQVSGDQQTWRVLAHASAFIQFIGVPSVVGPLIVWLIKREDPVVEPHARAALNFQLSVLIYFFAAVVIAFIAALTIIGVGLTVLIALLLPVLFLLELVFAVLASIAASKGEPYRYPFSLDLIKG